MRKLLLYLIIVCSIIPECWANEKKKEDLYSQLNRAIIRLEHVEFVKKEASETPLQQLKPNGTGFFVQYDRKLFVVSARHVVEQPYDLQARVECMNNVSKQKEVILLKLYRDKWIFHPEVVDEDTHHVDVAAMRIKWIKDRSIKHFSYYKDLPDKESKNNFPEKDPVPPRAILVFGFPIDIGFELLAQRPFGRSGIISMQTGKKFLRMNLKGVTKLAEERCYLIDAEIFPGNSGSPVINQTSFSDPRLKLLGLISAANFRLDFAVVEPVSRIRETIELAKDKSIDNLNFWFPLQN